MHKFLDILFQFGCPIKCWFCKKLAIVRASDLIWVCENHYEIA